MVAFAAADCIAGDDFVRCRINDSEKILVLQIHVYLLSNRIILRHPRLAVEMESLHDLVSDHLNDRLGFAAFVGSPELSSSA